MLYQEERSKSSTSEGKGRWGRNVENQSQGGTRLNWPSPGNHSQLPSHVRRLWRGCMESLRMETTWRVRRAQNLSASLFLSKFASYFQVVYTDCPGPILMPQHLGFIRDQTWWKAPYLLGSSQFIQGVKVYVIPAMAEIVLKPDSHPVRYRGVLEDEETTAAAARALPPTNSQDPGDRWGWANMERKINWIRSRWHNCLVPTDVLHTFSSVY